MSIKYLYKAFFFKAVIISLICNIFMHVENTQAAELRVMLKWRHQFQFAGIYTAIAKRLYKDKGIDVIPIQPTQDTQIIDSVLNDRADIGIASCSIFRKIGENLKNSDEIDLVVLAPQFQRSPLVLITLKDSGINDLKDLHGKRIMLERDCDELHFMFAAVGLHVLKEDIVNHSFSARPLLDGSVDAMSAYLSDEPFEIEKTGKFRIRVFNPVKHKIDFYSDLLFSKKSFAEENNELIRDFISATEEGWNYAVRHKNEIVDLIIAEYKPDHSRDHLLYEAKNLDNFIHLKGSFNHDSKISLNSFNKYRWKEIESLYKRFDLVPDDFNIYSYLAPSSYTLRSPCVCCVSTIGIALIFVCFLLVTMIIIDHIRINITWENEDAGAPT